MESSLIDSRFAEEAERDSIRPLVLRCESNARRQRNLTADNGVTAKKIYVRIEDVHRAAFACGRAAHLAVKLRHHLICGNAFGYRLAVLAVAGQDVIVLAYG